MDIRREIQRAYRQAFEHSADTAIALLAAASRFQDVVGYVPSRSQLDRLLQGALLGAQHPLMKLLSEHRGSAASSELSVSGLKPATR